MSFETLALFVPGMFVVLGGIFAVAGLRGVLHWNSFRRRAVTCTGLVTEIRAKAESRGSDATNRTIYYPVLAFRTVDGKEVQTQAQNGSSPTLLKEGQQVNVLYDPKDPTQAYAGRGTGGRVLPFVFAIIGIAVAAFGIRMLVPVVVELLGRG